MSSFTKRNRHKLKTVAISITSSLLLVVGFLAFTRWTSVEANTPDNNNVHTRYPAMVGTRIDSCFLCHTSSIPNLNPFGAAYKANGRSLSALAAIEPLDSDSDGFTNLQEITALTFPGDSTDHPTLPTPTNTPTRTPTNTPTRTPTNTPTRTPTNTPTNIPTHTPTNTLPPSQPTATNTPTSTLPPEMTPTDTPTPTATLPGDMSPTPTVTASPTPTVTCQQEGEDDDNRVSRSNNKNDNGKGGKSLCAPNNGNGKDKDKDKDKDKENDKKKSSGHKLRRTRDHGQIDSFDLALSVYDRGLPV